MRGLRLAALAAACLMALSAVGGALATDARTAYAVTMEIELGYGGAITYGKTIPMTVVMNNGGADVQGTLSVDIWQNDVEFDRVETTVDLPSGSGKRVTLPVRVMKKQESFTFTLARDGVVIAQATAYPVRTLSPYSMLVGVLARDPQALGYLNLTAERDELMRGETWQTIPMTKESFPRSADLLSAFGVIAVDGFDARTLDAEQRDALDAWLQKGGVLLLGGGAEAAVDYPYFEAMTGLAADTLALADDPTPAVMDYVRMSGTALGNRVMRNGVAGDADSALISDGAPILCFHRVGAGAIFTAAFALSDATLSRWSTSATMWQRILLTATPQQYMRMFRTEGEDSDVWRTQSALSGLSVENKEKLTPLFVLLCAFVLLATLGAYWLLKKLDRREWLWLAIPLLSFGMAAVVWGMSGKTTMNRPVVVSVTQLTFDGDAQNAVTYLGVTTKERDGYTVSAPNGEALRTISEGYYYDAYSNEEQENRTPAQTRYTLHYGKDSWIGMPAEAPWSVRYLKAYTKGVAEGSLTASVWYEQDGLHAEITNTTPYELSEGYLITRRGFCSVGRVAPGATVDAAILYPKEAKQAAANADVTITDGVLLASSMNASGRNAVDLYQIIGAIVYPEGNEAAYNGTLSSAERRRRETLSSVLNSALGEGDQSFVNAFIGFNDQIGGLRVAINGSEDVRTAHQGVMKVTPTYEAVGRTGVVYYMPGILEVVEMETDDQRLHPVQGDKAKNDSYYQASAHPVVGCLIPEAKRAVWETLRFTCQYVEGDVRFSLYNFKEDCWDEQPLGYGIEVQGEALADYISPDGLVAVTARPGDGAVQGNSAFYQPAFELVGKGE